MMVVDQNLPIHPIAPERVAHDPLAAILDRHACPSPTVGVRAGVHRVRQHVVQRVIDGCLPFDRAFAATLHNRWKENVLLPAPKQHLPDCLEFSEFAENEQDAVMDASIRVLLDTVVIRLHVANGDGQMEFARRAFWRMASTDRCRKIDNSISLMVPFIPSNSRSLGERGS